jgi:hypothetical protein
MEVVNSAPSPFTDPSPKPREKRLDQGQIFTFAENRNMVPQCNDDTGKRQ